MSHLVDATTTIHHSWTWEFLSSPPLCCLVVVAVAAGVAAQRRTLGPFALVGSEPGSMPLEGPHFRFATDPQGLGTLPTSCLLRRPIQEPHQVAVTETRVLLRV